MASMAPPSDYSDDAERIDRDYIPDDATTQAEVEAALNAAGFPEASQSHISDWLVSESEAWDVVGTDAQYSDTISRKIQSETGGTVSSGRADNMAASIESQINDARSEALGRVDENGMARAETGENVGKIQNIEEEVREDGIYFRNTDTGYEARAASFPNGGSR